MTFLGNRWTGICGQATRTCTPLETWQPSRSSATTALHARWGLLIRLPLRFGRHTKQGLHLVGWMAHACKKKKHAHMATSLVPPGKPQQEQQAAVLVRLQTSAEGAASTARPGSAPAAAARATRGQGHQGPTPAAGSRKLGRGKPCRAPLDNPVVPRAQQEHVQNCRTSRAARGRVHYGPLHRRTTTTCPSSTPASSTCPWQARRPCPMCEFASAVAGVCHPAVVAWSVCLKDCMWETRASCAVFFLGPSCIPGCALLPHQPYGYGKSGLHGGAC